MTSVPGGQEFSFGETMAISLAFIIIIGFLADALFRRARLPGLVGMLMVGVLVGPTFWTFCRRT